VPRVFVSIGSNIEKEKNLRNGITQLRAYYAPLTLSTVYESAAIGFNGDPFYNLVAAFDTGDPLTTVCANFLKIEYTHGRQRGVARFSPRTLDLDLLLYGDWVKHDAEIHIPRPEIAEYAFVLCPLAEIAPAIRHPETGTTFKEMWQRFNQPSQPLSPVRIEV
jgi:2-amino-4-hydroxy-6-hydroxymethyldihydropteridine diphosphokinase